MSNDTSTLSGALLEMKDQLIYELGQKGVTASYDSSTGLLGLIGRISDIQTGGSCYHIEFSEASYVAVGGSATLEVYLQSNYQPLSGATVTVTGSDSSLYTGITNSQGIAEITVSSITGTVTFTASYSNVTDTCTVIGASYLFYDACDSATGLSNYGSPISLGSNSTATLSYDSTMNAYKLTSNSSDNKFIPITALDGLTEFKLTMEWYQPTSSNYSSTAVPPAVVGTTTKAGLCYTFFNDNTGFVRQRYSGGSWRGNDTLVSGIAYRDEWLKIELTIEDTSVTMKAYRSNSDTAFATDTYTLTNISSDYSTASNRRYGLGIGYANNSYGYFRNIKAESL